MQTLLAVFIIRRRHLADRSTLLWPPIQSALRHSKPTAPCMVACSSGIEFVRRDPVCHLHKVEILRQGEFVLGRARWENILSHIYIYVHGKSVTNKTSRENNNGTNASREREISRRSTLWQALSRRSKVEDQKKFDKQMTQPFFWGLHHHFVGRQSRQFCKKKKLSSISLSRFK